MAITEFTGLAVAVQQVDTFTPGGTIEADDIFILTATGLDGETFAVSVAAGGTAASDVTAALTTAWNNATNSLATSLTAADLTGTMTLTADTAGVAFSVAQTTTEANGDAADAQTFGRAATTKNEGPQDYSSVGNWTGGEVPGDSASTDAFIEGYPVLYGFNQSGAANTLDSMNITRSQIGTNPRSGTPVIYLQIKATDIKIGYNYGPARTQQNAPVNLDNGSIACTIVVSGSATNSSEPAIRLKTDNAAANIQVLKGIVGIAHEAGETAQVGTVTCSYTDSKSSDSDLFIGDGVTITTLQQTAGDVILRSAVTTATIEAGTLRTEGSGAIATLNANGGIATLNSTGDITTMTINDRGKADFTKSVGSRTITNLKLNPGGNLTHDPDNTTITNWTEPDGPISLTASAA